MLYRNLAGEKVSVLGFGIMRLIEENGMVPVEQAIQMIRYAIDQGINYLDTSYIYHHGNSESIVGKALLDGYRQKVKLATKLPIWLCNDASDPQRFLAEQLEKLNTLYIDYYLIHGLHQETWELTKRLKVIDFLEKAVRRGEIRHFGFSFHDSLPAFRSIIDYYNWEFCQIQYNYMDEDFQAGKEGLLYAKSKNVDLVIMEPLRGGNLAKNIPEGVTRIWKNYKIQRSPAEWALRWLWNQPEISVVLSGMNDYAQIDENIRVASEAFPDSLTEEDLKLINRVKEEYRQLFKVNCTACGYCMPCPVGVDIQENFSLYNSLAIYTNHDFARIQYNDIMNQSRKAANCKECGICEKKCPQKIPIRTELKNVDLALKTC